MKAIRTIAPQIVGIIVLAMLFAVSVIAATQKHQETFAKNTIQDSGVTATRLQPSMSQTVHRTLKAIEKSELVTGQQPNILTSQSKFLIEDLSQAKTYTTKTATSLTTNRQILSYFRQCQRIANMKTDIVNISKCAYARAILYGRRYRPNLKSAESYLATYRT